MQRAIRRLGWLACVGMIAACQDHSSAEATQVVASVSGSEVTESQLLRRLRQMPDLTSQNYPEATRAAIAALVDQEVVLKIARDLKLDRNSEVVDETENAKRTILVSAYLAQLAASTVKPSDADIHSFYLANPLLFAQRKLFDLYEVVVETADAGAQGAALAEPLRRAHSIAEVDAALRASNIPFRATRTVAPSESLPLTMLAGLSDLRPGQTLVIPQPGGLRVVLVQGVDSSPLTEAQGARAIAANLLQQRQRELIRQRLVELRAQADIKYYGKYADAVAPLSGRAASAASTPISGVSARP